MKKIPAFLLIFACLLSLCGCGAATDKTVPAATAAADVSPTATPAPQLPETEPVALLPEPILYAEDLMGGAYTDPSGWSAYDALLAEAAAATDAAARRAALLDAEAQLITSYCVLPLYYAGEASLLRSSLQGVYTAGDRVRYFTYAADTAGSTALNLNFSTAPESLDPAYSHSLTAQTLAQNCFSGLYTYAADGSPVPACAESLSVEEDGLTCTVTLRENLRWSNGIALTAADFAYAWQRAAAADATGFFAAFASADGMLSVSAPDARTLCFVLAAPCENLPALLTSTALLPVRRTQVEARAVEGQPDAWCGTKGFLSNGPYACTGYEPGISVTYEKNPYWYDAAEVTVKSITVTFEADAAVSVAAYRAGTLDFTDTVTSDCFDLFGEPAEPGLQVTGLPATAYLAFNSQSALFSGKTPAQAACLRAAVSLLLDRSYLCAYVGRTGQQPADTFLPRALQDGTGVLFRSGDDPGYYDARALDHAYNDTLLHATRLLLAAGYRFTANRLSADTPLTITLLAERSSAASATAEALAEDFAVLGIRLETRLPEHAVFTQSFEAGSYDLLYCPAEDFPADALTALGQFCSGAEGNPCRTGSAD